MPAGLNTEESVVTGQAACKNVVWDVDGWPIPCSEAIIGFPYLHFRGNRTLRPDLFFDQRGCDTHQYRLTYPLVTVLFFCFIIMARYHSNELWGFTVVSATFIPSLSGQEYILPRSSPRPGFIFQNRRPKRCNCIGTWQDSSGISSLGQTKAEIVIYAFKYGGLEGDIGV